MGPQGCWYDREFTLDPGEKARSSRVGSDRGTGRGVVDVVAGGVVGEGEAEGEDLLDERVLKLCTSAFEAVWERAVPHAEYRPA
ncbi:hypothetical protein GCM10010319_32660 [Streptomyces blastmyceticus]|uniref:Uncharacterized protein n=1 Tax=Streptomyces blastmyceticus TaxID=68180 RepID=A0ABN0X1T2_9ACTN